VSKPTFTAIVTVKGDTPFPIMTNLATQTVLPTQVLVGVSDYPLPWVVPSFPFPWTVAEFPGYPDFGYSKRNALIQLAESDYVGFFSHDDSYDGDYIEQMLKAVDNTGAHAAYCQWDDGHLDRKEFGRTCTFNTDSSTLGNFIVRRDLLLEIGGFPMSPRGHGLRDGELIEAIRARIGSVARINVTLYHHNKPYSAGVKVSVWGHVEEDRP
jgi:hypothetical protein